MAFLTQGLYLISTGLLVPVIIVLFVLFIQSLLLLGGFYASYITRTKHSRKLNDLLPKIEETLQSKAPVNRSDISALLPDNDRFSRSLQAVIGSTNGVILEKALSDFELACEKELDRGKILIRMGPMFGLMGTLIPMAPALAGLAAGDLSAMADNMQVAFSTTVIGVLVGAIGFFSYTLKRRWFKEDMRNLEYVKDLVKNGAVKREVE
ncbi:MAG: MotA/TolQ/ExbB proton channel family protein [Chitinivibrionales bacterium]|nr:MotA/TolQ/ExbB proton channel family protein [Chitinivibrionales bacterium]